MDRNHGRLRAGNALAGTLLALLLAMGMTAREKRGYHYVTEGEGIGSNEIYNKGVIGVRYRDSKGKGWNLGIVFAF